MQELTKAAKVFKEELVTEINKLKAEERLLKNKRIALHKLMKQIGKDGRTTEPTEPATDKPA